MGGTCVTDIRHHWYPPRTRPVHRHPIHV